MPESDHRYLCVEMPNLRRLLPLMLIGLMLSACANQRPKRPKRPKPNKKKCNCPQWSENTPHGTYTPATEELVQR
jgi:hypothetical protein